MKVLDWFGADKINFDCRTAFSLVFILIKQYSINGWYALF